MKDSNIIQEKAYAFAVKIVLFCREMMESHEYVLSKQLLRSGTGIGANIEEAQQAQSRPDFISKMNIALKEAYESRYWLRLVRDTSQTPAQALSTLLDECEQIIKLLVSIVKSSKQ